MGAEQSSQVFLPVTDFEGELKDYLLDAPVLCNSDLQMTVHFVTGLTCQLSGVAAVFTRDQVHEADLLLAALAQLRTSSPIFPKELIFRQPPRICRFDAVWITEGRGKLRIFERYLLEVYRERSEQPINRTDTRPVSIHLLECPQSNQTVQLLTYRGRDLRSFNPYLKEIISWMRLRQAYIRSVLDIGMTGLDSGEYAAWVKMEHYSETLEHEIARRKTIDEPFTEAELLYLLHQVVYALRYVQETTDLTHPGLTASAILLANGVYKVDFGAPWSGIVLPQRSSSSIGLGQTMLHAAALEPPSSTDVHKLPYSNKFKHILECLLDPQFPLTLKEIEIRINEMTILPLLAPFEQNISRLLSEPTLRLRKDAGQFCYPPQVEASPSFSPFRHALGVDYYVGETNWLGQRHGRGISVCWQNDDIYEGEFRNGAFSGAGRFVTSRGYIREGEFGPYLKLIHGTLRDETSVYEGEDFGLSFSAYYGVEKFANGDTYEGTFYRRARCGWGILTSAGQTLEGEWKNGVFEGKGTARYSDGSTYTGNWVRGCYEGEGVKHYANGGVYSGLWKKNKRHGRGKMTEPGQWEYTGEWEDDVRQGAGTCKFLNGDAYVGNWVSDQIQGKGIVIHFDGTQEKVNFSTYQGDNYFSKTSQ